jgi:hypothetical protein
LTEINAGICLYGGILSLQAELARNSGFERAGANRAPHG